MNGNGRIHKCSETVGKNGASLLALLWVVLPLLMGGQALGDAIHVAALYDDDDALYELIKSDPPSVNAVNEDGDQPLHIAARKLHRKALVRLLNANADYEATNRDGFTALHLAIMSGGQDQETAQRRVDAVQVLLLQGASPDTADTRGWTAIHHAAANGRFEVLETLRAVGAKLDATDKLGRTPMHLAAQSGQMGVLDWLSRQKLDISARDKQGFTPLHCAAGRAQVGTAKHLLRMGASITEVTDDGRTALHMLVDADLDDKQTAKSAEALVKLLIEKGAPVDAKDKKGKTAAELAEERKHPELAKWIRAAANK